MLLAALAVIATSFLTFKAYNYYAHKRKYDALPQPPRKWPLLGHLPMALSISPSDAPTQGFQLCKQLWRTHRDDGLCYVSGGPITDVVFVYSAEYLERILTLPLDHLSQSKAMYLVSNVFLGGGLFLTNGAKHARDKRLLAPAFHTKVLQAYEHGMAKHADILCDTIEENGGEFRNTMQTASRLTMGMTVETLFGVRSVNLQKKFNKFQNIFERLHKVFSQMMSNPLAYYPPLAKLTKHGAASYEFIHSGLKIACEISDGMVAEHMERYKSDTGDQLPCLTNTLASLHLDGQLSILEVKQQIHTFWPVAHDTMHSAITFALLTIANHPEVQDRLRAELHEAFGDLEDAQIDAKCINKLKYLDMAFKEVMRVFTPPMVVRHLRRDIKLGPHSLPRGTQLVLYMHGVHFDDRHWPEPEVYNPDRFQPEVVAARHKYAYLPFGAGERVCIGDRFAKQWVKMALVRVLRKYRVLPVTKWHEIELCFAPVIGTKDPIQLKFEKL